MTTERRQPSREPLLRSSPLELRLYVAALLATVYTITWRAIADAPTTQAVLATAPAPREPQRFVWIDSMPATARPVFALPVGWQLASAPGASSGTAQPARVLRTPSRRVPRVRTRSS